MTEPGAEAPSIADYALIGDCRIAALVSRDGSIDWLCLPVFSGPSVFARILDPHGGRFSLRPKEPFTVSRRYLDGTAVLETTFTTGTGVARVLDGLPILDGVVEMEPLREVLRVIEGVSGTVGFEVVVEPRPDYARAQPRLQRRGRLGWFCSWGHEVLHVGSEVDLHRDGAALTAVDALERLRDLHPNRFRADHLRTVQRFMKVRRATMARDVLFGPLLPEVTIEVCDSEMLGNIAS